MQIKELYGGFVKSTHYLPTVSALRYLNCCKTAGWHNCNRYYRLEYGQGVPVVFAVYTIKGAGWIKAGQKDAEQKYWELTEGTLCVLPPNTPMEYGTCLKKDNDCWEFFWLNLDGDYVCQTAEKLWQDGHSVHYCRRREPFRQVFQELLQSPLPESIREVEQSQIIQELFQGLIRERMISDTVEMAVSEKVAEQMLNYIQKNYMKKISLDDFCNLFFLSKNQIIRVFRKRTGYSPYEYIKQYRLMKACELLQSTKLPVNEIGICVGYCNNSLFSAQFRECYGMTPVQYRRMFSPKAGNNDL